jgi:EPS-associated MarR family transcriptional regulator
LSGIDFGVAASLEWACSTFERNIGRPAASSRASARQLFMIGDEISYGLFKLLEANPDIRQREAAQRLGVSLGKVNYCLRSLVAKGWIKAVNFKNSNNKMAYTYLLTPQGIEAKTAVTRRFLHRKMKEYEALRDEIERTYK